MRARVNSTVMTLSGALALAVGGFVLYNLNFVVNTLAMTVALYAAMSIVVGSGAKLKKLLCVFVISALVIVISELVFSFFHQFVALCISLFVLLAMTKYSLIKDHDSGWPGALFGVGLSLIFLLVVEIILVIGRLFLI